MRKQTQINGIVFLNIGNRGQACMDNYNSRVYQLGQCDSEQAFGMGQGEQPGHGVRPGETGHRHAGDVYGDTLAYT